MKIKLFSIIVALILLLSFLYYFLWKPKVTEIQTHPVSFTSLPGWKKGQLLPSFTTFQTSCGVFLKLNPNKSVGNDLIALKASDWLPACQSAQKLQRPYTEEQIKTFFQTWFDAFEFHNGRPVEGLFTGYYMPALKGSLTKTETYGVPIYGMPDDLISIQLNLFDPAFKSRKVVGRVVNKHHFLPYYTRAQIDRGALRGKAPVIAWVESKVDRLFLEIQGSGVIELDDGAPLYIGYTAQNGKPYTAIASVLIKQGVMTRDNASMQHIRNYLEAHPEKIGPVIHQNKSFIFFEISKKNEAYGSQGVPLTPGYSMAVDPDWVPLGMPVWLSTTRPDMHSEKRHVFQRLMIAQDTGGAIRGPVRGDIYWGAGKKATSVAGKMKNPGHYWMLVPKKVTTQPSE